MPINRHSTLLACAMTLGALGLAPLAQAETLPLGSASSTSELTGKVTVVNPEQRMLTIETPDGHFEVIHAPDEAQRLDEIEIGDTLTVAQTDLVLVNLHKGADAGGIGVQSQSGYTPAPGDDPAGTVVDSVTVTGVVQSVDPEKGTTVIQAPDGNLLFKGGDPVVLADISPGDTVSATYIRAISGQVTPK